MPSFGLKTNPVHTTYADLQRAWAEAEEVPQIEHVWLWDHFLPLYGDTAGPIFEGWTMLTALAARTERVGIGLLVTNNAARRPAVLAKIATTVDVVSDGRLVMGLGVGGTRRPGDPQDGPGMAEYAGYDIPAPSPAEGIARLAETCEILRGLWTREVFDYEGRYNRLRNAVFEPKPVQRPGPPILIGGQGPRTLRVVAEHADIWNIPGPPHNSVAEMKERARILGEHCAAIGRDPSAITRSAYLIVRSPDPAETRTTVLELMAAGFDHFVFGLAHPPAKVAHWLAEEIITPVLDQA